MCFELIGVALSIAGSFMQAQMQAQIAQQQAKIQAMQLKVEIENENIKSMADMNDRTTEWLRAESANKAAISASGLGSNISYDQGIAPYNKKVAYTDLARRGFERDQVVGRKRFEIKVAQWEANTTARSAYMTAAADSLGAIGSLFS